MTTQIITINNISFSSENIQTAEWVDRGSFCDAYILDIENKLHTVQGWYDEDILAMDSFRLMN